MATQQNIAQQYIQFLEAGDVPSILGLFAEGAIVHSPLYGQQLATDFYQQLNEDTGRSRLEVLGTFTEIASDRVALYFRYNWTLADGSQVDFEVVDILVFNHKQEITELKIIYDTVDSRKAFDQLRITD